MSAEIATNLPPRVARVKQVAEQIGISRATVYNLVAAGKFPPPRKFGGASLFSVAAVAKFADDLEIGADMPDGVRTRYDATGEIVPVMGASQ